ncbi:hypothetical protein PENTCL1PPCAC_23126, partial [Pristionchus entomophagus]
LLTQEVKRKRKIDLNEDSLNSRKKNKRIDSMNEEELMEELNAFDEEENEDNPFNDYEDREESMMGAAREEVPRPSTSRGLNKPPPVKKCYENWLLLV